LTFAIFGGAFPRRFTLRKVEGESSIAMIEAELFHRALEKPTLAEQLAFLDQACADQPELRERVERLLRSHRHEDSFLDAGVTADQPITEIPGTVIGPYKLLQQIGEGGMGTVFMAEQTRPVQRKVALKVVKPGMDSRQVIARFEAERQALAMMDHLNIARVFDGGTTENGRPYFVMELVHGVPITKYCDDNHLTPRERLELFVPVCQAIQHAHQKGIIHRDIKPSNVMVTLYDGKPVPKVIDFGVAKATEQKLTERTLFTQYGTMVGTLEYMSPEQAEMNALGVDTRSDIYSLGVLLYELLTGSTPLTHKRMKEAAYAEILRMIKEEEPPRPSTRLSDSGEALASISANRRTEPTKLTRLVKGELDWIVMKTLEKDRNRRYETANGFAADVQRYLADEAVEACPPSVGYRFRKFARRNKGGLAVAGLILFFLVLLGSGGGWVVRDRSAREAEAARQQAQRQAKVIGQVESIFAEINRLEAEQKWPEALSAAQRAEAAVTGGEADTATAQRVRERLKDLEFFDRLEQIRMQRATWVEGMFDNTGADPGMFDNAGADREYARAFREYGLDIEALVVETSIDRLKARPALAIGLAAALDEWVNARRRVSAMDAAGWKRLVAVAHGIDPEPLRDRLRATWGQPVSEVQDELRRLAESIDIRRQHPATLVSLASSLRRVKHLESAVRLLREAQYVYPADFWLNFELANALGERMDHEGAIRFYTAAVSIRPNSAASHNNLGNALRLQKKLDQAIACYYKAIEIDPKLTRSYVSLGNLLGHQKKQDEAIAAYRTAIKLDPKLAMAYENLGLVLLRQGKLDEAIDALRQAVKIDPNYATAYYNLGIALRRLQRLDEAIDAYRKAVKIDPKHADAYCNLGCALRDKRRLSEAVVAFHKAIEIDPKHSLAYHNLGVALRRQGKPDHAIDAYRKVIEIEPNNAKVYASLGLALHDQRKLPEAIDAFRQSIKIDPKNAMAYNDLGVALADQKRFAEAIDAYHKAIDLDPKNAGIPFCNIGRTRGEEGKAAEAIEAFHKAIEIDSKAAGAWVELGKLYRDQKLWQESIHAFHKAIEIDEKKAAAHNGLGITLYRIGEFKEAADAYQKAIAIDQNFADAYCNLGLALQRLGKPGDAIAACSKAIQINSKHANAHSIRGLALEDQGKVDEAITNYRKAIELDSKHADAHNNLANAFLNQGKTDVALDAYRKAIELEQKNAHFRICCAILLTTCPDPKFRDPREAVEHAKKAVEFQPQDSLAWQVLGWAQYRAGDWRESVASLEQSCKRQPGGTGDHSQWIVLALAHARLAAQPGLPEKARESHKIDARRWFEQANKSIDSKWRVRPGYHVGQLGQAIWDFREEVRALMPAKVDKK
jgi:eukaryotic-like serine/threonine-protein kinase